MSDFHTQLLEFFKSHKGFFKLLSNPEIFDSIDSALHIFNSNCEDHVKNIDKLATNFKLLEGERDVHMRQTQNLKLSLDALQKQLKTLNDNVLFLQPRVKSVELTHNTFSKDLLSLQKNTNSGLSKVLAAQAQLKALLTKSTISTTAIKPPLQKLGPKHQLRTSPKSTTKTTKSQPKRNLHAKQQRKR